MLRVRTFAPLFGQASRPLVPGKHSAVGNRLYGMRLSPRASHGGLFWHAADPARPETLGGPISADVLDAWFAPCPAAVAALQEHAEKLSKTSPPTYCEPVVEAICLARGLDERNVVVGPGSSSLVFLALRELVTANCRAVVQEPTYSEYTHLFESVIGCDLLRRRARPGGHHEELEALADCAGQSDVGIVALVNPANPGGGYVPVAAVLQLLKSLPERTLLWIDEAYLEYVSGAESLEPFVARHPNLIVCKTMSKVYALSGLRVA